MPGTPPRTVLIQRISALQSDLKDVFTLALQSSRSLYDYGIGENTYASLYNSLRAEAEKITGEEPPMPKAPPADEAGGFLGLLSALKALTGQLAVWMQYMPRKAQP